MRKIRTLVVDDEPLARSRLVNLLNTCADILLIGECGNGKEATTCIKKYRPDLVFLDIQMPDLDGFDVLTDLKLDRSPFIIFVTAYDHFAIKAFDIHAVDYLLKPFDDDRFMQALEHAREQIHINDQAVLNQKLLRVLDEFRDEKYEQPETIFVQHRGQTRSIHVLDIGWIEAHGNYLKLHVDNRRYLIRSTLQAFYEGLNRDHFLRIHRSLIINKLKTQRIRYRGNNEYQFVMEGDTSLTSGRSFREEIELYLKERA